MKTILIATDFSPAARNAFHYGVIMAQYLQANVVLLHVVQPVIATPDIIPDVTTDELKTDAEVQLLKEVREMPFRPVIEIKTLVMIGDVIDSILEEASNERANYTVVGMKGEGKAFRKVFGSIASALTRHTRVPMVVVPESISFTPPVSIALATDIQDDTNMHILDPLCEIGETFRSNLYIVRVIKRKQDELVELLLRPSRLKWHLKKLHPSFEFMNDKDVAHALTEFVHENDVSMVCMIAQEHYFLERLLVKINVHEMIFQTTVPLLILPGKLQVKAGGNQLQKNGHRSLATA